MNPWIPALAAYYRAEGMAFQRAESLEKGWMQPDASDLRVICALQAALPLAPAVAQDRLAA